MNYRVDEETGLLWIFRRRVLIPCVPESKILSVLRLAHDGDGHWGKQSTLAKLRNYTYWPTQSTDVEHYIQGCLHYARHGPATKSQLLHPVKVKKLFQLLGMDFTGPLAMSIQGFQFILHIIDYFSWFSITTPTKTGNASDVIPEVDCVFTHYATPLATYCDQSQHFDNQKVREFFQSWNVSLTFSPTGISQSTGMIEISNRLLENILQKTDIDWEMALNTSTGNLNGRVIQHLGVALLNILLEVTGTPMALDFTMRSVGSQSAKVWIKELTDPTQYAQAVQKYFTYRAQLHDMIRQRSDEKKDREATQFNVRINEIWFSLGQLVMLYQKDTGKLQS